jgi:hypothetical protein
MTEQIPLSNHCAARRHTFCTEGMAGCGCSECHFICTSCLREVRKVYGADSLCPTCYSAQLSAKPQTRCDEPECTSTRAYRDPRHGNEYLCIRHHRERGHRVTHVEVR